MGRATAIILPEPGLTATFIPNARPDDNRIELDLTIAASARVGLHRMSVITPLGVPAMQSFAVAADPEVLEKEPNDVVSDQGGLPVTLTALPATLVGSIDRPGDVDIFRFEAKAGEQLVFQVLARAIGSQLRPELIVLDTRGHVHARATAGSSLLDPVLTFMAQSDGLYFLRVADADFGGSGSHFYRIAAGQLPIVLSVFPLGIERGRPAEIEVIGSNLAEVKHISIPADAALESGTILEVPMVLPGGRRPYQTRTVVVTDGPVSIEQETNDAVSHAQNLSLPGGVSGHVSHDGDVDYYRFRAEEGGGGCRRTFRATTRLANRFDRQRAGCERQANPPGRPSTGRSDRSGVPRRIVEGIGNPFDALEQSCRQRLHIVRTRAGADPGFAT